MQNNKGKCGAVKRLLEIAITNYQQSNTYAEYSQAIALNNFDEQTYNLNSIELETLYQDWVNIFTANEAGLYEWCIRLQVGTLAVYRYWFKNIRFGNNPGDAPSDHTSGIPANFANGNGDIKQQDNTTAGNFNDTTIASHLSLEQIRLVVLMKYYTQYDSGSIENIYAVLGKFLSFYYNQHRPVGSDGKYIGAYDPSKNINFLVIDCLVNSEYQYQGVLWIYHDKPLWQPYDGSGSEVDNEKLQYVFQYSGILPTNIGQVIKFIYTPTLPTQEEILTYYTKPQKIWDNSAESVGLNNAINNMITKTWCNQGTSGAYPDSNVDYSVPVADGDNNTSAVNLAYGFTKPYATPLPTTPSATNPVSTSSAFSKLLATLKGNGLLSTEEEQAINMELTETIEKNVNDAVGIALAPTRQNMNGILRQIYDNILFHNQGQPLPWVSSILYEQGSRVLLKNPTTTTWYVCVARQANQGHEPKADSTTDVYWFLEEENYIPPTPTGEGYMKHINNTLILAQDLMDKIISYYNYSRVVFMDQNLNVGSRLRAGALEYFKATDGTAGEKFAWFSDDSAATGAYVDATTGATLGYRQMIYENTEHYHEYQEAIYLGQHSYYITGRAYLDNGNAAVPVPAVMYRMQTPVNVTPVEFSTPPVAVTGTLVTDTQLQLVAFGTDPSSRVTCIANYSFVAQLATSLPPVSAESVDYN